MGESTSTGCSLADMSALLNNNANNGMNWNSPMWLIWALMFGGNGWFGNRNGAAEAASTATIDMNAKLNQLSQQIQDNQSANTLNAGINSNHDYLHDMQNAVNMGFAGTNAAINQAAMGTTLGQKDMQSAMQSGFCSVNNGILNQTNQIQSRIDQLSNGVAQGFAQVGFLTQQQTNELNNTINSGVQAIKDQMCQNTQQELRDKILQYSQDAQTATILAGVKSGCGCNS